MSEYSYHKSLSSKTRSLNLLRKCFRNALCENILIKINHRFPSSRFSKLVPPEYLYKKGSYRIYERGGERFNLDISNVIEHFKYFGFYDAGFERLLAEIEPSFCVVDIGANIGTTTVSFAKRANLVISFEPSAQNYQKLIEALELNKLENVIPVNKGIGRKPGEYKLYKVVDNNPGMNRLLPEMTGDNFDYEKVTISTLGRELADLSVEKVDLIKIDVEGFEYEVLLSAEEIIERDRPLLFVELDDDNLREQGASASRLVSFIMSKEYAVINAANSETLSEDYNFENCHIDIFCQPTARRT
jgi:FkbM family methyltransferase